MFTLIALLKKEYIPIQWKACALALDTDAAHMHAQQIRLLQHSHNSAF